MHVVPSVHPDGLVMSTTRCFTHTLMLVQGHAVGGACRSTVATSVVHRIPPGRNHPCWRPHQRHPVQQQQQLPREPHSGPQQRAVTSVCRASQKDQEQQESPPPQQQQQGAAASSLAKLDFLNVSSLVGTPLFTIICIAELVVILGVVDAAYSGDWSRIGAITKADELALQKVVWVIAAGHAVTAGLSAKVALQRGQAWALPAVKGFLFGALGVYEQQVMQQRDGL